MISLTCTSCKKVLQIDDAFAGGVCRCQHCGTIQTVAASLKNSPNAAGTGSRALYQRKSPVVSGQAAAGAAGAAIADSKVVNVPSTDTSPNAPGDSPEIPGRTRAATPEAVPVEAPRKLPTLPLVIAAAVIVIVSLIILLAD